MRRDGSGAGIVIGTIECAFATNEVLAAIWPFGVLFIVLFRRKGCFSHAMENQQFYSLNLRRLFQNISEGESSSHEMSLSSPLGV